MTLAFLFKTQVQTRYLEAFLGEFLILMEYLHSLKVLDLTRAEKLIFTDRCRASINVLKVL